MAVHLRNIGQSLINSEVSSSPSSDSTSVPLLEKGGTYLVPAVINESIKLNFVIDSGAADVSIPADVVMTLLRTGTLQTADFMGEKTYQLADGSSLPSATFRVRSLAVGGKVIENVNAAVAPVTGTPLLGQSFLSRLDSWSINNRQQSLSLESASSRQAINPAREQLQSSGAPIRQAQSLPNTTPTPADDYKGLGFSPQSWGDEFNKISALLGGNDPRANKVKCLTNEDWVTCQFKISDRAYVMTQGKSLAAPAKSAWMIVQSNDALQAAEALLDWVVFVRSIEPRIKPAKAGEVVKELIGDLPAAAGEEQVVQTDTTKFTLVKLPTIGLSLTATARE
jgi:clan AA aspartic protease (TIGR02281 family)